jgi:hypothetical protein
VFLRSLSRTRHSLKALLSPILDLDFSPFENTPVPSQLLADHILRTLRFPQLPLPQNLDEIMCLMQSFQKQPLSCLQEYIYSQYSQAHAKRKTPAVVGYLKSEQ